MKRSIFCAVLFLFGCGQEHSPSVSSLQNGPDANLVSVQSINYGGTGCPQGTVAHELSADRNTLTLIYDQLVASTGPGIPLTENRKNCQVSVNLVVPSGFSYAIATIDFKGFVQLTEGVRAEQKAIFYFQGEIQQSAAGTKFLGPVTRDYLTREHLGGQAPWMPCLRSVPLNISSQARIMSDTSGSGILTTDSIDGKVRQILGIQWRRC